MLLIRRGWSSSGARWRGEVAERVKGKPRSGRLTNSSSTSKALPIKAVGQSLVWITQKAKKARSQKLGEIYGY